MYFWIFFVQSDYTGLDNTTQVPIALTEYQLGLLFSVAVLLRERSLWGDMSDLQWDTLLDDIDALLGALYG